MLRTPPPTPSSERRGNPRGGDGGILLRLRRGSHLIPALPRPGGEGKKGAARGAATFFVWGVDSPQRGESFFA